MPPRKVMRIDKTMSKAPQMQGLRSFKPNLKIVRLTKEWIENIRKFLQRQSNNLGHSIGAILSQALTNREVSSMKTLFIFVTK